MIERMNDSRSTGPGLFGLTLLAAAALGMATLAAGCTRGIEEPARGARAATMATIPAGATAKPSEQVAVPVVDTASAAPVADAAAASTAVTGKGAKPVFAAPAEPDRGSAARKEVLSAPLTFSLTATAMHKKMQLRSEPISGDAGFLCAGEAGGGGRTMKISRFAQYGHTDTLFLFQWVVSMEPDQGSLTARPAVKNGKKGYEVTLAGKLALQVLLKSATQPLKMLTRDDVTLQGFSPVWPPYGVVLEMQNGPANFYMEKSIDDTAIGPFVVVSSAEAALGKGPSSYFSKAPRITKAAVVDPAGTAWRAGQVGGVRLEWSATGPTAGTIPITGYNIYRSSSPNNAWKRIASVPASQTTFEDKDFSGREPAHYMVTHSTEFPIRYEYEGSAATPTLVKAVTR